MPGRQWTVKGTVYVSGKKVDSVEKVIDASSEEEIEAEERQMRTSLATKHMKKLSDKDLERLKIEVESDIK